VGDTVQDEEGQEFVLDTRGRLGEWALFGGHSLRTVLGLAASTRSVLAHPRNRNALARAMVEIRACSEGEATSLTLEELRPMVEAAMSSGAVSLVPYERSLRPPICDIEKIERAESLTEGMTEEEEVLATHILEIELVDEEDEPVANELYRVELPDGDIVQGRLNELGKALLTGIESSGNCKVSFPRLDESLWAPG
jgi:hypothetical protein